MDDTIMNQVIQEAIDYQELFSAAARKGDKIVWAINTSDRDGPLAHAEINAMNAFWQNYAESPDELYSTCEPCPMCMSGAIWSGVQKIYYGISIEVLQRFIPQIDIPAEKVGRAWPNQAPDLIQCFENECMVLLPK